MSTILVVDDEPSVRIVIRTALETRNHHVKVSSDGKTALEAVATELPDLIILDWMLPGLSGLEICQTLRTNPASSHIPIIFLTAVDSVERKVSSLESGADDYMTKPFDPRELLARVSLQLRKASERGQVNPLTLLPGNMLIEQAINRRLDDRGGQFALLYFDLDDFKAYNDHFGFSWGDKVLKALSESIQGAMLLHGGDERFTGHVGGDDFVAISTPDRIDAICRYAIAEFERRAYALCADAGCADGFEMADRAGVTRRFTIPTLSIGVVTNQHRGFNSYLEIGQVAAQVKKAAKQMPGSGYFIDRRQDLVADVAGAGLAP